MSTTAISRLNRSLAVLGAALVVATGVALVTHDGAGAGTPGAATDAAGAVETSTVEIREFLFGPEKIVVAAGTPITFTNADAAPHTATSGASPSRDGVFDTGTLEQGDRATVTIEKPGTYAYFCEIHPFMKGTVEVR